MSVRLDQLHGRRHWRTSRSHRRRARRSGPPVDGELGRVGRDGSNRQGFVARPPAMRWMPRSRLPAITSVLAAALREIGAGVCERIGEHGPERRFRHVSSRRRRCTPAESTRRRLGGHHRHCKPMRPWGHRRHRPRRGDRLLNCAWTPLPTVSPPAASSRAHRRHRWRVRTVTQCRYAATTGVVTRSWGGTPTICSRCRPRPARASQRRGDLVP